jgi:hypothetical protein
MSKPNSTAQLSAAAIERAEKLRDIAKAEDHAWVISEVLRHDASLLLTLSERLSRYESALRYMADYQMTGTEQTLHIDFQGKAREALS